MCLSYWFHKAKVVTSLLLQLSCSAATWSMLEEEVKFSFQKKTPFRKRLSFVREDLRDNHISNYCELTEGLKTHKTLWISVHTNGSPKHQYATIQDTTITHNGKTCLLSPSCTTCGELTHALHPRNHNTPTVHLLWGSKSYQPFDTRPPPFTYCSHALPVKPGLQWDWRSEWTDHVTSGGKGSWTSDSL